MVSQGVLPFPLEKQETGGLTALAGLMAYVELAHVAALWRSVAAGARTGRIQGYSDVEMALSLVLLNLAGGESVDDDLLAFLLHTAGRLVEHARRLTLRISARSYDLLADARRAIARLAAVPDGQDGQRCRWISPVSIAATRPASAMALAASSSGTMVSMWAMSMATATSPASPRAREKHARFSPDVSRLAPSPRLSATEVAARWSWSARRLMALLDNPRAAANSPCLTPGWWSSSIRA